ncbi:hypothetical protein bcCo53_001457 (plasmid) [Borrelia coriaceae]|uniref:Putative cytosolic protein n=1 Tax=Borrelia coriaceae ATCC 43381 TaxID=1408429 RepID=W5T2B0_9SPIR|nr:hypothetical protein [Borrelia coriaceae]AHH11446.1 Putative cytosolic protein [Borrelia coriaceae ATCC 43381]UPA17279.1 hypothetical protein bcCo53_001457 [Borrelia coriaceae]
MKKSILAICMLTLMCLFSCDINFLDELLDKAREKSLEEKNGVEDLSCIKGNQEVREEKIGIVKAGEDVELSQTNILTKDQEFDLTSRDAEANSIKSKLNAKLLVMDNIHDELNRLLLELKDMETVIMKAELDLNKARGSSSVNGDVKQKTLPLLHKVIDNVKDSESVAMSLCSDSVNGLEHAIGSAKHAKNLVESSLFESAQARLSGYYYVYRMVDNILKAKISLRDAENMFNEVKSKMGDLGNEMERVKRDFAALKSVHQVVQQVLVVNKR